ncbi:hypothetical protein CRP603_gp57 [Roseobacter phage CRP-603]|nr:hypothetical protein CRP603_gp57 [Roseobacter phage CRP-603]
MAYSTNPFSVATFGESYEQADASFTLTGVAGTGAIGTPDISSRTNIDLTGVQANGAAGSATAAAEAVVVPLAVTATGAAGAITVDGGVGTTPTITMTTAFTASLGSITVSAGFGPTIQPVGFGLQAITDSPLVTGDEVIVESDANISLAGKGVGGTGAVNTVTLDCKAVVLPVGVQGTFTVGDETINTVQFDYEAIKTNYSRDRTAYIGEYSTLGNTVYVRAA